MSDRPKRLTKEMTLAAATEVVAGLVEAGLLLSTAAESAAREIAEVAGRQMDGYEIATALDRRFIWDCNLEMADELDNFAHAADGQIETAQKVWFAETHPEAAFVPGDRVAVRWGGQPATGTVDSIFPYGVAQYVVKIDGEPNPTRMAIINWEDASELPRIGREHQDVEQDV